MPFMVTCKTCGADFQSGIQVSKDSDLSGISNNSFNCPAGHVNSYDGSDMFWQD